MGPPVILAVTATNANMNKTDTGYFYDSLTHTNYGQQMSQTSGTNGNATVFLRSTDVGTAHIYVFAPNATTQTLQVTFPDRIGISDTPPVWTVTLSPLQQNVVADGNTAGAITATLSNSHNQLLSGPNVNFTIANVNGAFFQSYGSVGENKMTSYGANTVNGSVTVHVCSPNVGQATVTASALYTQKPDTSATVTFTQPQNWTLTLAPPTQSIPANGIATDTLTATLKDGNGALVPNAPVTFNDTTTPATLGTLTVNNNGTTNDQGVATATFTAGTTTGTATFSARQPNVATPATAQIQLTQPRSPVVIFYPCSLFLPYDPNPIDDDDNVVNAKKNPPLSYAIDDDSWNKPWVVTVTVFNTVAPAVPVLTRQVTLNSLTDKGELAKLPKSLSDVAGGTIPDTVTRGIYSFNVDVTSATNGHDYIKSQQLTVDQINVQSTATDGNGKATATVTFTLQGENAQTPPNPTVMVYDPALNLVANGAATKVNQQWQAVLTGDASLFGDYTFLVWAENPAEPTSSQSVRAWSSSTCKPPSGKPGSKAKPLTKAALWLLANNYDEVSPFANGTKYSCDRFAVVPQTSPVIGSPYKARANGAARAGFLWGALPQDRVFFIYAHGNEGGLLAEDNGGYFATSNKGVWAKRRLPGEKGLFLEDLDPKKGPVCLKKLRLAVLAVCWSATTERDYGNLMKQIVADGTEAAVGFYGRGPAYGLPDGTIPLNDPETPHFLWSKYLFEALCWGRRDTKGKLDGKPVTLREALGYAAIMVYTRWHDACYTNNATIWPTTTGPALKLVPTR